MILQNSAQDDIIHDTISPDKTKRHNCFKAGNLEGTTFMEAFKT